MAIDDYESNPLCMILLHLLFCRDAFAGQLSNSTVQTNKHVSQIASHDWLADSVVCSCFSRRKRGKQVTRTCVNKMSG